MIRVNTSLRHWRSGKNPTSDAVSPRLPVSLSLCHPVTLSPCHIVTLSTCQVSSVTSLPVAPSPPSLPACLPSPCLPSPILPSVCLPVSLSPLRPVSLSPASLPGSLSPSAISLSPCLLVSFPLSPCLSPVSHHPSPIALLLNPSHVSCLSSLGSLLPPLLTPLSSLSLFPWNTTGNHRGLEQDQNIHTCSLIAPLARASPSLYDYSTITSSAG